MRTGASVFLMLVLGSASAQMPTTPQMDPKNATGHGSAPQQSTAPSRNQFFVRDQLAIAAAKGWGRVAPFYVELETATGANDLPRAGRLVPSLRNEHLQYALTWYGLAAVLAVAFVFWVRSRRREAHSS